LRNCGLTVVPSKAIRRGFIRKVYGILTVQLSVTIAVMCPFIFVKSVRVRPRLM
jgi:FtsH-binding integral membrane protein